VTNTKKWKIVMMKKNISPTMETKFVDEENEDNQKEKFISKEVNLEADIVSPLVEIDKIRGKNMKEKEKL
jgi:hypothetical protein